MPVSGRARKTMEMRKDHTEDGGCRQAGSGVIAGLFRRSDGAGGKRLCTNQRRRPWQCGLWGFRWERLAHRRAEGRPDRRKECGEREEEEMSRCGDSVENVILAVSDFTFLSSSSGLYYVVSFTGVMFTTKLGRRLSEKQSSGMF